MADVDMAVDEAPPPVEPVQLSAYYAQDYPVDLMFEWLSHGKPALFKRREWVFQKDLIDPATGRKQDKPLMVRYKSYDDAETLRKGIQGFDPNRIEIGPVYTHQPKLKDRAVGVFEACERELIFDIDASDYDDIRVCCQDKKMCDDCWMFMAAGVRVLDKLLREDFGFKHLMWVFSGRRGVHCWVSDTKARKMTNEQRAAVAKYLEVYLGGKSAEEAKLSIEIDLSQRQWMYPSFKRLHETVVTEAFHSIVLNPDNLNNLSEERVAASILGMVKSRNPPAGYAEKVEEQLSKACRGAVTPKQAWDNIKKIPMKYAAWIPTVVEFMYTIPRLDVMVSTKRNHLLKSPYSIHPGTGLVCVPFRADEVDTFKPFKHAPHLAHLQRGALPRIDLFQEYVEGLAKERREREADQVTAP
eukprot:TRINITY_DN18552_c0_g2_i1.p1 TRINITY_DN18552_c0_g2~~TRINITY_DN18552_c0_g2_i1.p1  ORF type:complete len:430 (+),score=181.38 TRINITY_DN18552_c0_g2_i1:52-1290(+)